MINSRTIVKSALSDEQYICMMYVYILNRQISFFSCVGSTKYLRSVQTTYIYKYDACMSVYWTFLKINSLREFYSAICNRISSNDIITYSATLMKCHCTCICAVLCGFTRICILFVLYQWVYTLISKETPTVVWIG